MINKNNHKSERNFLRAKNLDEDKQSDGHLSSMNDGDFDDNESCELAPDLCEYINNLSNNLSNNRDGDRRSPNGGK